MHFSIFSALVGISFFAILIPASSCSAADPETVDLSRDDALRIGRKIWVNECSGTVQGLTSWNRGEDFASLGIGHFIWYSKGGDGPFEESWPKLIEFMKGRNVSMPRWIKTTKDCPWKTLAEFEAAKDSDHVKELRKFLANTIEVQTDFIVDRLQSALPKMVQAAATPDSQAKIRRNFFAVAESPQGVYALIDYVNFKGEGVSPNERYNGQGWGLAQVLLEIKGKPSGASAAAEFGESAKRVLKRRVGNAPAERNESRWLEGWSNRCDTYGKKL
ncbi:MAG: hypothetical protein ACI8UO_000536 [Verrucomicrobiales bacterium]|jgi:hypothetical protein